MGQPHGGDPLIFQPPCRQCLGTYRQGRQQGIQRQVAAQVHTHDARYGFHGAQRCVQALGCVAGQHHRHRGFAPRRAGLIRSGCSRSGRLRLAVTLRRGVALHDAHRLQRRLAVLGGLCGDVQQNQRAAVGILQLQPRGFDRFAGAQVDRTAGTLHTQPVAHAGRHADAHVAIHEHDALLTDLQRHGQRQTLPVHDLHGMGHGHQYAGQHAQPDEKAGLHGESPCWPRPPRAGASGVGAAMRCGAPS